MTVSSTDQAAELIRTFRGEVQHPTPAPGATVKADAFFGKGLRLGALQVIRDPENGCILTRNADDAERLVLSFLKALRIALPVGISGEKLAEILGVAHLKGLGSRTAFINTMLIKHGFQKPAPDVYNVERTNTGSIWKAGPLLPAAINEFRDETNASKGASL